MPKLTKAYQDFLQGVSNPYLDFIEACRKKSRSYSKEQQDACYTHHVVPRHHYKTHRLDPSTLDLPANLVRIDRCSYFTTCFAFEDHVKAHELRFEVYGEYGDKVAFKRMQGLTEEGMRAMQQAGGQAVNVKFKNEGRLMHDPEYQREMARRSMARADALEIRSQGGKKGGKKRQANRILRAEDRYEWSFQGVPFLCTFDLNSGGDVLRILNAAQPTNLVRVSQLITGERKRLYGWSCRKLEDASSRPADENS